MNGSFLAIVNNGFDHCWSNRALRFAGEPRHRLHWNHFAGMLVERPSRQNVIYSSSLLSLSSNPVAFNVDISKTGSSSMLSPVNPILRSDRPNWLFFIALFFVLIWILWSQSLRPARRGLEFAACSLAFLTAGVSGCGGGTTLATAPAQVQPPPQPQVTPKGTHSVIVTARSGKLPGANDHAHIECEPKATSRR